MPLSLCFSTLLNDDETDRHDESPNIGEFDIRGRKGWLLLRLAGHSGIATVATTSSGGRATPKSTNRSSILSKDDVVQSRPPTTTGLHQHRHE